MTEKLLTEKWCTSPLEDKKMAMIRYCVVAHRFWRAAVTETRTHRMATEKCPICGHESLVTMHGEYRFEPPANIPGGVIVVGDAQWLHCGSCGEDILSRELEAAIEGQRARSQSRAR